MPMNLPLILAHQHRSCEDLRVAEFEQLIQNYFNVFNHSDTVSRSGITRSHKNPSRVSESTHAEQERYLPQR